MDEVAVVTCFLRNRGEILLLRRSEEVGSYTGRWGGVAGHAEGNPDAAARQEIREETGIEDAVSLVRAGDPFPVEDAERGTRWIVYPYLFDCESRSVTPNEETDTFAWVPAPDLLRRTTVPELWRSYRAVAPTVETIRRDRTHGSGYLSVRALEVLRDRAGAVIAGEEPGDWSKLRELARELRSARPSMVVIRTRIDRAMVAALEQRTPAALEAAASAGIERAIETDEAAATTAAGQVSGTVLTLSRSGTVATALEKVDLEALLVAESRPGGEGIRVAEAFASDLPTTLVPDAGVAQALVDTDVSAVLVGADTVRADGAVINKLGTRAAAVAAAREGVPVYATAASDKVASTTEVGLDPLDATTVYDGGADLAVAVTRFDVTPADLVSVITENGLLSPTEIEKLAAEHRRRAEWEP